MQAYVNEPFLQKRAKIARYTSLAGLVALVGGVFTVGTAIWLSYALLMVGLLTAATASYISNQYIREPRADKVLQRVLDGLDKRYALYSYYLPSDHVVASHRGLTVIVARAQRGAVTVQGKRWQHHSGWRKILQVFGEPGLGRPDLDLQVEVSRVQAWVAKRNLSESIPVSGIIVFTHPQALLTAESPAHPAMVANQLPDFLRQGLNDLPILSTAGQKELRRALDEVVQSGKRQ